MDAAVENCRKIIDAVKPQRTVFSIEMMPWSLPTNPDDYLRFIKAVDRNRSDRLQDVFARAIAAATGSSAYVGASTE